MRLAVSTALITGIASVLNAQSDTTRQQRDTAYLEPTVVTVLRTTIELSRAPFAIGVADREQIQRGKPGLALDEALTGIAGVQVDNRFNYALGERISIRGLGARAQFGVRGVRVLLDGIPMTLADGQTTLNNVDVASVARAEVIRGPASAQHGNAAGGVIQLQSNRSEDISARPIGGELRVATGDDGLQRQQLSTRLLSEKTSFVVSGSRLLFGGYRDWNDARNHHATFQLTRDFASGGVSLLGNWVGYDARNPGALPRDSAELKPEMAWPANKTTFMTGEEGKQGQLGVTWRQRFGGVDVNMSGHGLQRHVDNPIPQRIVVIDRDAGGGRFAVSAQPLLFRRVVHTAVGTELQLQHDDRKNFVNTGGARGAIALDQIEKVRNSAVFAQASVALVPRIFLMLGTRYDRIRFRAEDRLVGPGNPDDSGERAMSATSPSLGLTWSASSDVDLYSNYSTSFETPTTSELANQESGAGGMNPALDPQRTRSVEIGINGRVRLPHIVGSYQVAAYDARVRDALIPFEVATAPGRQYFRNAGSTKHRGIESSTSLVFPNRLSLRASYTHTDALFERYSVTTGTTTTTFDGNQVPGVARNRADATLSFQPGKLFLDFESRAASSIPVNDVNSERSPSYVVHSLRAGVRDVRVGAVEIAPHLGVLNLFDRAYNTSVVINAFGGRFYEPGPPRSAYVGLNATF
jgi:iron complex outermembrane receptor protein